MMRTHAELISAYFDESLTPEEGVELRKWLDLRPENWRTFVRESVIHSRLRDVMMQHDMRSLVFAEAFVDTIDPDRIASLLDEEDAKASRRLLEAEERAERDAMIAARRREMLDLKSLRTDQRGPSYWMVYASVAATAALLMIAFRIFAPTAAPGIVPAGTAPGMVAQVPATGPIIAEITGAFDADLARGEDAVAPGARLHAGPLRLSRGVAEVKFSSDVTMVVEAPAEVELLTADRAKLISGRVVVRVPKQALGFTLHSDAAAFVDLGTEFGVEITRPGVANIHVLDGEVAFVPENGGGPSRTLRRGFANQVSVDGAVGEVAYDEQKFVRRVPNSAYELAVLKSRPLAYWRLDDVAPQAELLSEGKLGLPALVRTGVAAVDNRKKPGNDDRPAHSARFVEEHEGIDVPPHDALGVVADCTYEAWVRPVAGEGPQRIFSTFDRPLSGMAIGAVDTRWYKLPEDELRFHVTVYGRYDCISTTPLTPNKWVHLAATIDAEGTPTLYVDGQEVDRRFRPIRALRNEPQALLTDADVFLGDGLEPKEEEPRPWFETQETPLGTKTTGAARIGRNPEGSDGKISPERWLGEISNVATYDRVLTAEEIQRHAQATRDRTSVRRANGGNGGK